MRTLWTFLYGVGVALAAFYLLNPTAGVFELVPDNLPIVGHLDEAAAAAMLLGSIRGLRKVKRAKKVAVAEAR